MARFQVGQSRVDGALRRTNTPPRRGRPSKQELLARSAERPKARAIEIPETAKRVSYEPPPPPPKGKRGDAYRRALAHHFAKPALGLTPEEQQDLVRQHFEKGKPVTVVPPGHAIGALRFGTALGAADGRKK